MSGKCIDMMGKRFGRLTVIGREPNGQLRTARWRYRCDCGNEGVTDGSTLRRGDTKSCGCWNREVALATLAMARTTHGRAGTPGYITWRNMRRRCLNPADPSFKHYGGRGIVVCDRWKDSFAEFLADMGDPPAGMTIERVDNDGPYAPDNCRWATRKEQMRNYSRNRWVTINGETLLLDDWAKRTGLDHTTIRRLILAGRPVPGT